MTRNTLILSALACLLVSCAADPVKVFEIRVMDTEEKSIQAVVGVGDDWKDAVEPEKGTAQPYITNPQFVKVPISFEKSDEVLVRVRDVELDDKGKMVRGQSYEDPSDYKLRARNASRQIKKTDPEVQVFFLEYK